MYRTASTALVAVVLLAGCATSAAPTATPAPTPPPTPVATPAPTPTSAPSVTDVKARVTFDGTTCTYEGPTDLPFPASLSIESRLSPASEAAWVGVVAIKTGTTLEQVEDPALPAIGEGTPSFAYLDTHAFASGSGTWEYRAVSDGSNPMELAAKDGAPVFDTFLVICIPTIPGKATGGSTILHLVG